MSNFDSEHPRVLIPELCKLFYGNGWVTGTGGGISIKRDKEIYIAASGVQKERILGEDIFVMDENENEISTPPTEKKLKASQCTPLFFNAYKYRDAGAVIHTHSQHAVMVTLLYQTEFIITHQEMIKGILSGHGENAKYLQYFDRLVIPIIENTPHERDLKERMHKAMEKYPNANAVLVRRHGVYVWGPDWVKAKTMCECFDYLFEIAIKMKQMGLDPTEVPHANEECCYDC
ncbi:class II aldolase/adducin, N-terminal domain-containing protein [Dictyostelium discoideum AX4]|uniref:Probable methylthioribulose-1-phosphate dehydratase n=1 Tax=Dictyostelium discoideum TaxID=44689 RepID=MTNB_DICDI|nr:class II aldolase/adducin, N-terminal domain-containing protein [Dictyostelium discoideum AX4]Q54NY7.1 RecName: Full=Probable methylthioribulose-1-phosphate dehydratase; Short=MTRu-1-P dehydratase [Dictyostelium discoideum]EAL64921.1 class II aldolase/adducin, N-terminal domain-containing protein [Dictyostelium discoideum AX4]|eukprot:XP_639930.1 class II aldolase/adducin, N-terminal domain-containing protein [Dictyostelium discoideum AX4]